MREWNVLPVEDPSDALIWQIDRTTYDTEGLAAYCLSLLEEQMLTDDPTGAAQPTAPRRRD